MRIFIEPAGLYSRAMIRIARALERYRPSGVDVVHSIEQADLAVLYLIDYPPVLPSCPFVAVQCCLRTTHRPLAVEWYELWRKAELIWSYYDLDDDARRGGFRFYHAPLGLDDAFTRPIVLRERNLVITSGYVSGYGAEAIEDTWHALSHLPHLEGFHVGPYQVQGMASPPGWQWSEAVPDDRLADLYHRAAWVSSLRYGEGFELPAAEGLACGARPILFDQPSLRHWYGDHAVYVDAGSPRLVDDLIAVLSCPPKPVLAAEREWVLGQFNWSRIVSGFWSVILGSESQGGSAMRYVS